MSQKQRLVPPLKLDTVTLEGLELFSMQLPVAAPEKHTVIIPKEELKFFSLLQKYTKERGVDFTMLQSARDVINSNLNELMDYGITEEAGTRLQERGHYSGKFYGLISGVESGGYEGELTGRISSVHNLPLSEKAQSEYIGKLAKTVEAVNEPLSKATKYPEGGVGELSRILNYLDESVSDGRKIDIGLVNEINGQLQVHSDRLNDILYFKNFAEFDSLSVREKYDLLNKQLRRKVGRKIVEDNLRTKLVPYLIGSTTAASFGLTTYWLVQPVFEFRPENAIYFYSAIALFSVGLGAMMGALQRYGRQKFYPYSWLQHGLAQPSVNRWVKDSIYQAGKNLFAQNKL